MKIKTIYFVLSLFLYPNTFSSKQKLLAALNSLNHKYIQYNYKNLHEAISIFHSVPKFDSLIDQLKTKNDKLLRGTIYEIVEAVNLVKENKFPKKFQCEVSQQNLTCTIYDCGNDECYWEMKNIYWPYFEKYEFLKKKFKSQILRQKMLAELYGFSFQVRSNYKFTDDIKKFLEGNGIDYKDDKKTFQDAS